MNVFAAFGVFDVNIANPIFKITCTGRWLRTDSSFNDIWNDTGFRLVRCLKEITEA